MLRDFFACYYKISEIYKFKEYSLKRAFIHLIILTLIFGSVQGYIKTNSLNKEFNLVINAMSTWNFTIQDGKFIIEDAPKSIDINDLTIYFPKDNEKPNFDENRGYLIIDADKTEAYVGGSITELPGFSFGNLSKDDFLSSLRYVNVILNTFSFILTLILFFISKIISAYFIAALINSSITAKLLKYKFSDLFKLSFYIMTLVVTIQSIFFALGFDMFLQVAASALFTFISFIMLKVVLQYEFKKTHS
ncbi:MAG: DUF1189 domain-containing protein [Oscillospiraceae bacterium]|nr:DUF1189 domain-containing protein [Oscillospiraceae bacterium]